MKHDMRHTAQKVRQRLELISPLIHRRRLPLEPFRYQKLGSAYEPAPLSEPSHGLETLPWDSYWGEWLCNFALHGSFEIPPDWMDAPLALYLPLGESGDFSHPEALVYVEGIRVGACDRHHQEIYLDRVRLAPGRHSLLLHGWIGLGGFPSSVPGMQPFLRECSLVQIDRPTRDFTAAARVALGVVDELEPDDPARDRLLNALDEAFKALDTRHPLGERFYATTKEASAILEAGVQASGAPLEVDVLAIGHAHIDVAWLWTLQQTRRKAVRTFSTALALMEEFPDYRFSQSQAQLYRYVEEDDPELFERIRERVDEGRWEVMGGTWVEPDCNATGAESLARQFLLGIEYFRGRFGDAGTKVLWLPDTFGYSWSLPQLIREAGFEYFVTHKMSWNQYNAMPFQSMWWQGLDGSRVLTHLLTTPGLPGDVPGRTTYNGDLTPRQVLGTWRQYRQKEGHRGLVTVYGYGDGGGGPTREMLEGLAHMREHPGLPRLRAGTVREFLEGLAGAGEDLPVWNGEFYLEYHRGTYTSQGRTKRNNRKSEFLLHDAEFLATYAWLAGGFEYPRQELREAWELVCLNQFHDILPGSSIAAVYEDAEGDYARVREIGEGVKEAALEALAAGQECDYFAVNPTSFAGDFYALLIGGLPSGKGLTVGRSGRVPSQQVEGGTLLRLEGLEPYSVTPLVIAHGEGQAGGTGVTARERDGGVVLENGKILVEIDSSGDIARILDKELRREVLLPGMKGNQFQLFEDRPLDYDAWDIDIYYDDRIWSAEPATSLRIVESGPLRAAVEVRRKLMESELTQFIHLYADGKRIDFVTTVDWHERHMLLKVAFPVDILATSATYDIQWGNVERPTHRNTSWDWARFETSAYKYVDLSEGDYGVSLLNDCKHGYDVHGNLMRLTLLKGATSPDPEADLGLHQFTYSLLPHEGDWRGATIAESYRLNDPVMLLASPATQEQRPLAFEGGGDLERAAGGADIRASLVSSDHPAVVVETVKQAEDGDGMIVRLYESARTRGEVVLRFGFEVAQAFRCNLLEERLEPLEVVGDAVTLDVRPYQIVTLRLLPRQA